MPLSSTNKQLNKPHSQVATVNSNLSSEKFINNNLSLESKSNWDDLFIKLKTEISPFSFLLLTPKQQLNLKLVCKKWKEKIDSIPYLFNLTYQTQTLPTSLNKLAVAIASVNSSGDIYHIIAMTALSATLGTKIPRILWAEDEIEKEEAGNEEKHKNKLTTSTQQKRALNFAANLGYKECFFPLHTVRNKSAQPSARQKSMENELLQNGITHYLDGRLSTALIAECCRTEGFDKTTTILRKQFTRDMKNLEQDEIKLIDQFTDNHFKLIKKICSKNQRPTVVIHYRYSDKANKDQNISSITPIIDFLKNDYNLIAIYAGTNTELPDVNSHIFPFNELIYKEKDLGKFYHLAFLLKLYEEKNNIQLKGIIGNTSGTLDMAALIGHQVFNIHNFANSKGIGKLGYQSKRLLSQTFFMTIENGINNNIFSNKKEKHSLLINNLHSWLNNSTQPKQELVLPFKPKNAGMEAKGLSLLSSIGVQSQDKTKYDFNCISNLNRFFKECEKRNAAFLQSSPKEKDKQRCC